MTDPSQTMLEENPLIGFSMYTHSQVQALKFIAAELRKTLGEAFVGKQEIGYDKFNNGYGLFWVWVLGAYEVTRTMARAKGCFSQVTKDRLSTLLAELAIIRMPFAKQELQGCRKPIGAEASVSGFDFETKDMLFDINGTTVSVRKLLSRFEQVMASITRQDVLLDHRESYG